MSDFKGTKGVWSTTGRIKSNSARAEYITIDMLINGSGVEGLAHVYEGCLGPDREVEMMANAKLIACATEMLEVMIELINGWESAGGEMWLPDYCQSAVDKMKRLITKATTI